MSGNMWDNSNILLSNQTGAALGAGLQGVAQGIQEYRKKKKDKEAEDAAVAYVQREGKRLGLPVNPEDPAEIKAAVKAAGGGLQAIQLLSALDGQARAREQATQQKQINDAILRDREEQRQAGLRSAGAARLATGGKVDGDQLKALVSGGASFDDLTPAEPGGSPDSVVAGYLRRSGDVGGAAGLSEALSRLAVLGQKERAPYPIDFGNGLRGVVANGNFVMDPRLKEKPDAPATRDVVVGGKKMTVGPGDKYFDDQGNPVQFSAERAPAAPPFELKATDPELYDAMRGEYLAYSQRRKQPAQAAADAGAPAFGPEMEGKKVKGPDGKIYVVRGGKAVLQ